MAKQTRRERIETLRNDIAARRTSIDRIAVSGRSRAEVLRRVDAAITALVTAADNRLALELARVAAGQPFAPFTVAPRAGSLDLGLYMVMAAGADALRARLQAAADSLPEGTSKEARAALLETERAELRALEIEEERLICEGEAEGEFIQRRADADPAIVLTT